MHVSVIGNPDDSVVITVRGNLDLDSAPVLTTTLSQVLVRPGPRIVIDLSGVEFCDSIGLSSFVVAHNTADRTGGWVRLASPSAWLNSLIETVGLPPALVVYPTVADALGGHDAR